MNPLNNIGELWGSVGTTGLGSHELGCDLRCPVVLEGKILELSSEFRNSHKCYISRVVLTTIIPQSLCDTLEACSVSSTKPNGSNSNSVAQQPMRARTYCAHPSIRDHWALRCMSRCTDSGGQFEARPQCLSSQRSLVLIYRPTPVRMKG
ncbi:hypothetical protein TNCV_3503501 [Trichonephila clavipes]|uniref:Uncharacterized protein n=1 Tax=Trichonephila clavipes TaxID=2585209 RepID=A0A8X6VCI8_TRICX|nr:hypothetical protein TNCV_3503501 [Trichonephila clavipes]